MTTLRPQITVITEAEAAHARAEVRPVSTPQVNPAVSPYPVTRPTLIGLPEAEADVPKPMTDDDGPKDYFIEKDGLRYAGSHLIIDMWQATGLDDEALVRHALNDAVERAGATLLYLHTHKFGEGGGVSGVAVLAESHISVHTWPERSYAAFDIFMCGGAQPAKAIPALKEAFTPDAVNVTEIKRGIF